LGTTLRLERNDTVEMLAHGIHGALS